MKEANAKTQGRHRSIKRIKLSFCFTLRATSCKCACLYLHECVYIWAQKGMDAFSSGEKGAFFLFFLINLGVREDPDNWILSAAVEPLAIEDSFNSWLTWSCIELIHFVYGVGFSFFPTNTLSLVHVKSHSSFFKAIQFGSSMGVLRGQVLFHEVIAHEVSFGVRSGSFCLFIYFHILLLFIHH